MRKLVFHIGPHKTASSYIQKSLSDNFEFLRSKGVLYPKRWRDFLWGHHSLVTDIMNFENRNEVVSDLVDFLNEEFKQFNTVVFSSENFEYWTAEQIQSLNAVNNMEIEIVYYVRKHSGLAFSAWQENIKHGSTKSFSEFLFKHFSQPFTSTLFNYLLVLKKFSDNLPNAKLNIVVYDNLLKEKIDIAEHFFSNVLDINFSQNRMDKVNTALSSIDIEIIRVLNATYGFRGIKGSDYIRNKFIKNKSLYKEELSILKISSSDFVEEISFNDNMFVSNTIYKNLMEKFSEYCVNSAEEALFIENGAKEYNVISSDIWLVSKNKYCLDKIVSILDSLD
tara:strand:+ start:19825 stop:20832 length:1008 start_codon:yes stop_codon:yes gene_type:complete